MGQGGGLDLTNLSLAYHSSLSLRHIGRMFRFSNNALLGAVVKVGIREQRKINRHY